ncbi:MAG: thiolase family protein [Deltaproteobacteria bacterium]|nr:thiolase family protein [Deltaproteobacteria bacterium]MCB9786755.1 thiolase family protein [Deltaproteobacteria bacterium]
MDRGGREAWVVAPVRTPIGRFGGELAAVRPDDLLAHVFAAVLERSGVEAAAIDDVIAGCANQAGEDNRNIARMAALLAGLGHEVPGVTVNRLCASSLEATNMAARAIWAGDADVILVGGVESMSRAPYATPRNATGAASFGNQTAWDTALGWRFPNPRMEALFPLEAMGCTAENLADDHGIGREAQDAFALASHQRAVAAQESGAFEREIVAVPVPQRRGDPVLIARDEGPRADTSAALLARLRPAFRAGGTVTAGNSSTLNDGACALLVVSREAGERLELQPMARIVATGTAGVDPTRMGIGPVPATRKALARAGWSVQDLDLIELNEAFAAQALAVMGELGLDAGRVNVRGGAIALGHPLGMSGARILTTLLHAMADGGARRGLATLCVGVGQGVATLVEAI